MSKKGLPPIQSFPKDLGFEIEASVFLGPPSRLNVFEDGKLGTTTPSPREGLEKLRGNNSDG